MESWASELAGVTAGPGIAKPSGQTSTSASSAGQVVKGVGMHASAATASGRVPVQNHSSVCSRRQTRAHQILCTRESKASCACVQAGRARTRREEPLFEAIEEHAEEEDKGEEPEAARAGRENRATSRRRKRGRLLRRHVGRGLARRRGVTALHLLGEKRLLIRGDLSRWFLLRLLRHRGGATGRSRFGRVLLGFGLLFGRHQLGCRS